MNEPSYEPVTNNVSVLNGKKNKIILNKKLECALMCTIL